MSERVKPTREDLHAQIDSAMAQASAMLEQRRSGLDDRTYAQISAMLASATNKLTQARTLDDEATRLTLGALQNIRDAVKAL